MILTILLRKCHLDNINQEGKKFGKTSELIEGFCFIISIIHPGRSNIGKGGGGGGGGGGGDDCHQFCMKYFNQSVIINMAVMQNFENISSNLSRQNMYLSNEFFRRQHCDL
jgi:hypothetical protein